MKAKYLQFENNRRCPLCRNEDKVVLSKKMQFGLDCTTVICRFCGFCFVSPAPTREAYSAFYQHAYARYYKRIHPVTASERPAIEYPWEKDRLDLIESHKPLRSAKVLEIGPGRGRFLKLVINRGASACAVEPSSEFRKNLEQSGIDVIGDFLESTPTDQKFDFIMLFQVLEHFHDPVKAVSSIKSLLKPGGIVVLDVPNIWKPFRSLDRYFLRYVHLSYFSPKTLQYLFTQHGFRAAYVDEGGNFIVRHNPLFAIFHQNESDAKEPSSYLDDWCLLNGHLKRYRYKHIFVYAPVFHVHRSLKDLRQALAKTFIGDLYRHLKRLMS